MSRREGVGVDGGDDVHGRGVTVDGAGPTEQDLQEGDAYDVEKEAEENDSGQGAEVGDVNVHEGGQEGGWG